MWGVCFVLISSSCSLVFGASGRLYFVIVAFPGYFHFFTYSFILVSRPCFILNIFLHVHSIKRSLYRFLLTRLD